MKVLDFLKNMNVGKKLAVIALSFVIPITALTWLLVKEMNVAIDFAAKEIDGVNYIMPVVDFTKLVAEHRGMANVYLSGGDVSQDALAARRDAIGEAIAKIDALDRELGNTLDTTAQWKVVRQDWQEINTGFSSMSKAVSFQRHTDLIKLVLALISHTGDTSNLILDPDLDSYYLMDMVVTKLPALNEELGVVRGQASGIAAVGNIGRSSVIRLYSSTTTIQNLADATANSAAVAMQNNNTIAPDLEGHLETFTGNVRFFTDMISQDMVQSDEIDVESEEVFDAGSAAIDAGYALFQAAAPRLTELLEARISSQSQVMYFELGLVALCIVLSALLTFWIMRSITRPMHQMRNTLEAISNEQYDNDIVVESTDEIGQAMQSLDSMQTRLREMIGTMKDQSMRNARIRKALNCVSANVMMADADNNITFINEAVQNMFRNCQHELQKSLPNFSAEDLVGKNIDVFHKNPQHQRNMLSALNDTFSTNIEAGSCTMQIVANPVIDEDGTRLGTVVEWSDLTESLAAEEENRQRLEEERLLAAENSRIRQALDNVNASVMIADRDYNIIYINAAAETLMKAAENDLRKEISQFNAEQLVGDSIDIFYKNPAEQRELFNRLTTTCNSELVIGNRYLPTIVNPIQDSSGTRIGTVIEWADRTQEVGIENEIRNIVDAAMGGDLSRRISLTGKQGFFEMLSSGINNLVDVSERVINDTVSVVGYMASGDLTHSIEADYQGSFGLLKENINMTLGKLTSVVGEISESAGTVMSASSEIAQGNTNLSQRTEEQAASLEETASSMEEMTSTVKQNADNARQANQLASDAREQAESGGKVVTSAVSAMQEITESSKQIADIISVIDEIAFQTNLLALNAAVEAARAGEQGRGFAVVASEVRNLAGRSATAAKEIKDLIKDSVNKVDEGSRLVDESGQTLEAIMTSVKKVSDIIAEIAAASQEQSDGIEQVNKAITQMDQTTQQNAALVEQAAAASEAMGEQARNLNGLVGFFTTGESYTATGSPEVERRGANRPWSGTSNVQQSSSLDFAAARTKHLTWKTRLRAFLDGTSDMSESEAVSHHDCDLGKWIDSTGHAAFGHLPEMVKLESIHADLHTIIKAVVQHKHAGNPQAAEQEFSKVESVSGQIVDLLTELEQKVQPGGSEPGSDWGNSAGATGTDDSDWTEF